MDTIETIVDDLFENKDNLVPIIGDEMFVFVNENDEEIPLQKYIVEYFEDDINFSKKDKAIFGKKDTLLKEMESQGYYGMTLLYNHYNDTLANAFKKALSEFYKNNRESIHLKGIVKRFLIESHYPLIITTSPFDIIEKDLNYKSSIYFDAQFGSDDIITESNRYVFHLFGPKQKNDVNYYTSLETGNYVTNENELLIFLHAINNKKPVELIKYLQDKFFLVLGCCLPNWFFRFLLYPIRNTGKVFLINDEMTSEKMNYYLNSIGYTKSCNIDEILFRMTKKIELEVEESFESSVFLSIAKEDKKYASVLKDMMEKEFCIKVWMYSDEIISGSWRKNIEDSFNKSKYFVPFITENYLNKLDDKQSGLYICVKEFGVPRINHEDSRGNHKFVQPILLDGTIMNNEPVTPETMNKWIQTPYCPNLKVILQHSRQIHTYKNEENMLSLSDCLDSNGYNAFEELLKSK